MQCTPNRTPTRPPIWRTFGPTAGLELPQARPRPLHRLLTEPHPAVVQLAPQLGDAGGAHLEPPRQLVGSEPERQGPRDPAVAAVKGGEPGREVEAEGDLVGDRRLTVVLEGLVEGVAIKGAAVG